MDIATFATSFVSSLSAPPPGSNKPGDLYADLQSRTLWLGVDPAVDPGGAVLVSDIVALTDQIAESFDDSKAYTDTQILTRAPTVHTHVAAQITNFTPAVQSIVTAMPSVAWVKGMIMMWSGSLAEIGVGSLAGWSLCDGSNGTPNLRDRFIMGAGNVVPGTVNPNAAATTYLAGQHTHTINDTALATWQIPSHQHTVTVYGGGTFNSGGESADHTHATTVANQAVASLSAQYGGTTMPVPGNAAYGSGGRSAAHYHATNVAFYSGGTSDATGGNGAHSHTAVATGDHQHTISSAELRAATPYYALAFIMKL